MLRINSELMRQRRIQLGWTSEELAEQSGLDARTIRRLEQGKTSPRLHTAFAVARALKLDPSALVQSEGPSAGERGVDKDRLKSAFKIAADTFETELTCDNFKEVTYMSSVLLSRVLAEEGKGSAIQQDVDAFDIVAAFRAADIAIRTTLGAGRELGIEDATSVLSLLLARYGIAFSRGPNRSLMLGLTMIDITRDIARNALLNPDALSNPHATPPRVVHLGEPPSDDTDELLSSVFEESGKEEPVQGMGELRSPWPTRHGPVPSAFRPDSYSYTRSQEEKSGKDHDEPKVEKSRDKR